ncbi:hypothetical protein ACFXTN_004838 [Malus domestica]
MQEPVLKNLVELVKLLGVVDFERGAEEAGGRGFYLKRVGMGLNLPLITFALDFLEKRGYEELEPPLFMRKGMMAKCAQLHEFDEELYKVTGEGDDKPVYPSIPATDKIRWIFKLLQEQKPVHMTYRELVACSNCTDFQSRKLEIQYGEQGKGNDQTQTKQYVHLLNSTLTATTRTMCCILENYQREHGVEIPKALQNYMGGKTFLHFKDKPAADVKRKNQREGKLV